MAILKMSKFNLLFFEEARHQLLEQLQVFKYVHFTNLQESDSYLDLELKALPLEERAQAINKAIEQVSYTIDTLASYEEKQSNFQQLKEGRQSIHIEDLEKLKDKLDITYIYEKTKSLVDEKDLIKGEIARLKEEINTLSVWTHLDVPLKEIYSLQECDLHMGTIPLKLFQSFKQSLNEKTLSYYDAIYEDNQYVYLIVINHQTERDMGNILMNHGFSHIELKYDDTAKETIKQLEKQIESNEKRLETCKSNIKDLTSHLKDFRYLYDYLSLKKVRYQASEKLLKTDSLNVMTGYVPSHLVEKFEKKVEENLGDYFYLQIEGADEDDPQVPILLENKSLFKPFESVTEMYALPKYNEIDPTPWFSLFYALFFGMMIGDAGYGLLMFLLTFTILKVINLRETQRNFIKFFYYLSFSTLIWGAIFGSFFGDLITLPALIDTGEDYNFLLGLSIALGLFHVFFALAIQAYMEIRRGKFLNALFDVGFWYMLLGGGIVYLLALFLPNLAVYKSLALLVLLIGMVGILLTGGRDSKGFGKKIAGGLYSLYGLSSYIGDFVSYSRLMALALASGFIAYAINLMVLMLFDFGIIGIVFGIVVFIVGQSFNIFLSILSSYVHTLRLTYVEFFGKFYEGGGKAFQMFRNATKYIDIK